MQDAKFQFDLATKMMEVGIIEIIDLFQITIIFGEMNYFIE